MPESDLDDLVTELVSGNDLGVSSSREEVHLPCSTFLEELLLALPLLMLLALPLLMLLALPLLMLLALPLLLRQLMKKLHC
ncbi:unnamed protein product [Gadus morhua 'NCC']